MCEVVICDITRVSSNGHYACVHKALCAIAPAVKLIGDPKGVFNSPAGDREPMDNLGSWFE